MSRTIAAPARRHRLRRYVPRSVPLQEDGQRNAWTCDNQQSVRTLGHAHDTSFLKLFIAPFFGVHENALFGDEPKHVIRHPSEHGFNLLIFRIVCASMRVTRGAQVLKSVST